MRIIGLALLLTCVSAGAVPLENAEWFEHRTMKEWPCSYDRQVPGWKPFDWLVRISRGVYLHEGQPVVLAANVQYPEEVLQGLVLVGGGNAEFSCNGKVLQRVGGNSYEAIFALPLRKGENQISIRLQHPESQSIKIHLTPIELDYVTPAPEDQLRALWRSVEHLAGKHPSYPAGPLRKEIRKLTKQTDRPDIMDKVRALQIKALVQSNPAFDFDEILLRRSRRPNHPPNWKGNTGIRKDNYGNEIAKLSLQDSSLSTVYRPEDGSAFVGDISLSYDAERMLISSISSADNTWQVFELNTDGSGFRQVTRSEGHDIDNYNGIYLPDGNIIFCSTANMTGIPCIGGSDNVGTLYTADLTGAGVRQLTFEQDADWYPWVMDDGKVMYLRWEYTDNSHYFTRILMTMNPDGSQQRSIYGSNSYWPSTLFYAKNIPDSNSRFAAIVSGHHGVDRAGELVLFDAARGEKDTRGVVQRIPGYGKEVRGIIRDRYAVGNWPRFLHPYPLSDTYFLAAGKLSPDHPWGIYLLDRFDNIVLLKEDGKLSLFEPVPLKPRPAPPSIPSRLKPGADDAVLYIQDIYEGPGLAGIPRGTVKQLRLLTYGYAYRRLGGHDSITIEGGWDTKRILGTVPVEEDGSVMVRVPHSTPISIQPLDENGAALQLMRSWLAAMPGESLSCVGCHESARTPPLQRTTLAMRGKPQDLVPWRGTPVHGFSFLREVQPILDRKCSGCHDGKEAGRPDFRSLKPIPGGREFAGSYHALHPYVRRPGCESDFDLLAPMDYHVSASELYQLLEKGHHGVELDHDEWNTLITWIDLNVPYYATWAERYGEERVSEIAGRARELRKKYTGVDDNPEWVPPPAARPAFIAPKQEAPPGGPALPEGVPFDPETAQAMQGGNSSRTLELGDGITVTLRRIPTQEGGSFWMAESELTNEQFRQFRAGHDSRFIDQQWKDHVFAGYPADEPRMPVIRVSWQEAMAFCEWLADKTGQKVMLPTEAQWEWACRAGSAEPFFYGTTGHEKYANLADARIANLAVIGTDPKPIPEGHRRRGPLTDFVPRDATFNDGRLTPDGTAQYEPNAWGLYDMHGNVAEWTRSDYDDTRKTVKGGSWRDRPERATAAFRLGYRPYQPVFNVGFRIIVEE
jgi:hypothetical protein